MGNIYFGPNGPVEEEAQNGYVKGTNEQINQELYKTENANTYIGGIIGGQTQTENTGGQLGENAQNGYIGGYVGEINPQTNKNQYPQEGASTYVGGLVGGQTQIGNIVEKLGGLFGGQVEEKAQVQNYAYPGTIVGNQTITTTTTTNLPVKQGFWSKFKSFLFEGLGLNKEIRVELSQKEEKVLTEVHDFLFQEISFKGFMNILKIGKDNNKK